MRDENGDVSGSRRWLNPAGERDPAEQVLLSEQRWFRRLVLALALALAFLLLLIVARRMPGKESVRARWIETPSFLSACIWHKIAAPRPAGMPVAPLRNSIVSNKVDPG